MDGKDAKDLDKSNYGPKGAGQYITADNVKRKQANAVDVPAIGGVKVKHGANASGMQGKAQLDREVAEAKRKSRKNPVKVFNTNERMEFMRRREAEAKQAEGGAYPEIEPKGKETKKGELFKIAQVGHGAMGPPTSLTGGGALAKESLDKAPPKTAAASMTLKDLKRLKGDMWHNPDTGTEIEPESGERRLMEASQNAANRMVDGWVRKLKEKGHKGDDLIDALHVKKSEFLEELAKRSKNVREKTRNIDAATAQRRREAYARKVGLKPKHIGADYIPNPDYPGQNMRNPEYHEGMPIAHRNTIKYGGNFGLDHELGHALMVPHGSTIREQHKHDAKWGGMNGDDINAHPDYETAARLHEDAIHGENTARYMEDLVDRRAGVGGKRNEFRDEGRDGQGNWQNPQTTDDWEHDRNEYKQQAQGHMDDWDHGLKRFTPGGRVVANKDSIHARINNRATHAGYGWDEVGGKLRDLRDRMEERKK